MVVNNNANRVKPMRILLVSTIVLSILSGMTAYLIQKNIIESREMNKEESAKASENSVKIDNKVNIEKIVENGEYSIEYPAKWVKEGGGGNEGYELISLYKRTPGDEENYTSKITVNILDKDGRTLEDIIKENYSQNEGGYDLKELIIDGQKAYRVHSIGNDENSELSTTIDVYIDYKGGKYASISGYYNSLDDINEIYKVQESFKILK